MTKLEENISGFLIFAFVCEIQPILSSLWGVQATPISSPEGKSPDVHAAVQTTQDTFFLHTYYPVATHIPFSDNFST